VTEWGIIDRQNTFYMFSEMSEYLITRHVLNDFVFTSS